MKTKRILLFILLGLSSLFYYSCDDSGTLPTHTQAGSVTFSQIRNLKTLQPSTDGLYYLWIQLTDTSSSSRWRILATFNINSSGQLVDASGNPVSPSMSFQDTLDLPRASTCLVTIEQSAVVEPGPTRLLGGTFSIYTDSISTELKVNHPLALGNLGDTLLRQGTSRLYIINTPTNSGQNCEKGIWFCDTLGNSYLANTQLDPGGGWQFRGWVYDRVSQIYTTTGRFYNPVAQDEDGAGPCPGPDQLNYNAPGQDWIGGCGNVNNMLDGNHEVFITLEPNGRSESLPPFNLRIYYQPNIVNSLLCRRIDNIFGQFQNIPEARIKITL